MRVRIKKKVLMLVPAKNLGWNIGKASNKVML